MAPKKRPRMSKKAADAGKADDGGKVSAAEASVGGKRKATGKSKESVKADDPPEHSHWLMKSEPESRFENGIDVKFGIEDLKTMLDQTSCWDGVRNFQARNFMRQMKKGQLAFFYHSNCKEPGIAGLMKVDVQYQRMMKRFIPLSELKKYHLQHRAQGGPLKDMALFTRARLSVQPLTTEEFEFVVSLEDKAPL
ncbi:thymocyte nuclear protein 1 isoform X2 [Takifugu rubripes]|uniref:thymocyte nuclear protein 1 isoform X2 n=1 Tax=Takifugu rubripes TaxID=31033 RepID=UPI00114601E2|nr:thymocyte nuclear protein 1 isoform X2 [Takifugu rubripes]